MKWPWQRDCGQPSVDEARKDLEDTRAQRPEVEAVAREIRAGVGRNNFIRNTFKLVDPGSKR